MNDNTLPAVPEAARPWMLTSLDESLCALPGLATAVPPGALVLARAMLRGNAAAMLEQQLSEWGAWATDLHLVRVLVGQAAAWAGPAPMPPGTDLAEARALRALVRDLRALPDASVALDSEVTTVMLDLLAPLARGGSQLCRVFDTALTAAGEPPSVADATVLCLTAAGATTWLGRPVDHEPAFPRGV